uniref:Reverse transcriptase domain-containing protein n=1 Tax=Fundulus heteroclitus TaxID=8078 RepID=A0A3Q2PA65_FUNHE
MGEKPGRLLAYRLKQLNSMNHIPGVRQSGGTAPLNTQDNSRAIKSMPPNKAPGLDCIPLDFYQSFEDILSPLLLDIYNEAFQNGSLPQSMHSALITLTHKKGKDALDPNGYRPISLLNCDQKLLAKVLN